MSPSNYPPISIVIPAFNEGESVRSTVDTVRAAMANHNISGEILVVDDGSSDDTAAIIGSTGARLIRHPRNLGYGASLKSGIRAAKNEWIVITDADLTYPIDQLPDLLKKVPDFDMVVGARQGIFYHGGLYKRVLRMIFKFLVEFATSYEIPDINSGFRAFRKSLVSEWVGLLTPGFSFTTTLTLLHFLSGRKVEYVKVSYSKRAGKSHVRLIRDAFRSLQFIFEAILAFNPIKAFLLLAIVYVAGAIILLGSLGFISFPWAIALTFVWSTIIALIGLSFTAAAIQLGSRVHGGRSAGDND